MAQPPLSRTIGTLETELGTSLFQRTTRPVSLSPAGQALPPCSRAPPRERMRIRDDLSLPELI